MIQLYALKRTPDVRKAERFFKERRVPYQAMDLTRHRLGARELRAVAAAVGLDQLVDASGDAWRSSTARFLHAPDALIDALCADPKLLRLPIVRNGAKATVGVRPEVWAGWIEP